MGLTSIRMRNREAAGNPAPPAPAKSTYTAQEYQNIQLEVGRLQSENDELRSMLDAATSSPKTRAPSVDVRPQAAAPQKPADPKPEEGKGHRGDGGRRR